jgi:hypothetical protein
MCTEKKTLEKITLEKKAGKKGWKKSLKKTLKKSLKKAENLAGKR